MRSLRNKFELEFKGLDGVIEIFNCSKDIQGYMIKIFEDYRKEKDLSIWIYESLDNKKIYVGYSVQSNVNDYNCWIDKNKVNFKEYPISTNMKIKIVDNIFNNIKTFYDFDKEIEITENISI